MELAAQFKKLRTAKGYSVYKLSKISDVSENYIRTIERGKSQPSVLILEKLLSAMGVSLPEFLNGNSDVMYPSDFERELVESVRLLPPEKAEAVLNIAKLFGK